MVFGHIYVASVEESDTLFLEFGVLLDGAAEGVGLRELAVLGHHTVARRRIAAWIGVEGPTYRSRMAGARLDSRKLVNARQVAGAQGPSDVAVGGDRAFGDLANELIDLVEKIHCLNIELANLH